MMAAMAVDGVMMAAPAFVPQVPWSSFVPLKYVARALSLSAVRVFEVWVALFVVFGAVLVYVGVMVHVWPSVCKAGGDRDGDGGGGVRTGAKVGAGARSGLNQADADGDDDDRRANRATDMLVYAVGGLLVVPMATVFLQAFVCGFPFGAFVRDAATNECSQVDCWGGSHIVGMVAAGVFLVLTVTVGGRAWSSLAVRDSAGTGSSALTPAHALQVQWSPKGVLGWAFVRVAVTCAGVVGTRINLPAGLITCAVLVTAYAVALAVNSPVLTDRHRTVAALSAAVAAVTCWCLVVVHFVVPEQNVDIDDIAEGTATSLVVNSDTRYDGEPAVLGAAGAWLLSVVVAVLAFRRQDKRRYAQVPFFVTDAAEEPSLVSKPSRVVPEDPTAGRRTRVRAMRSQPQQPMATPAMTQPVHASDCGDELSDPPKPPPPVALENVSDFSDELRCSKPQRRSRSPAARRRAVPLRQPSNDAPSRSIVTSPRIAGRRNLMSPNTRVQMMLQSMSLDVAALEAAEEAGKKDGGHRRVPSPAK